MVFVGVLRLTGGVVRGFPDGHLVNMGCFLSFSLESNLDQ